MEYPDYITAIQTIVGEYMPNESALTAEKADELGARLLSLDLINPNQDKKGYHQTVVVYRDQALFGGSWVPVTVVFKTNEEGKIIYTRFHTSKFIKEYGQEF